MVCVKKIEIIPHHIIVPHIQILQLCMYGYSNNECVLLKENRLQKTKQKLI